MMMTMMRGRRTGRSLLDPPDHLGGKGVLKMGYNLPSSKILDSKKSQDQARPLRWRPVGAHVNAKPIGLGASIRSVILEVFALGGFLRLSWRDLGWYLDGSSMS